MPTRREFLVALPAYLAGVGSPVRADRSTGDPVSTSGHPMFSVDHANSGHAPDARVPTNGVGQAWTRDVGERLGSPAVVDGTAFVGTGAPDRRVCAVDVESGEVLWRNGFDHVVGSTPAVGTSSGTAEGVYVTTEDGVLHALAPETGDQRWTAKLGAGLTSSPTLFEGPDGPTLYVGCGTGVYAVDAESGDAVWTYPTDDAVEAAPAVAREGTGGPPTVYVGNFDHRVHAVDATTGRRRWTAETAGAVRSAPAVVDGTVYVGSWDHRVYAFSAESGQKRWEYETGTSVETSPAVAPIAPGDEEGATVFVGGRDYHLHAIDAETGDRRWFRATDGRVRTPTVVGDTVVVVSGDGKVHALDARDGDRRWAHETAGSVSTAPAVVGGSVVVTGDDGTVYRFAGGLAGSDDAEGDGSSGSNGGRGLPLGVLGAGGAVGVGALVGRYLANRNGR